VNRSYRVEWNPSALIHLSEMYGYTREVKERIYMDSLERLSFMPLLTASYITAGRWKEKWARQGANQSILIFDVDEANRVVYVAGVRHKREQLHHE
jgi:hypothetical protein